MSIYEKKLTLSASSSKFKNLIHAKAYENEPSEYYSTLSFKAIKYIKTVIITPKNPSNNFFELLKKNGTPNGVLDTQPPNFNKSLLILNQTTANSILERVNLLYTILTDSKINDKTKELQTKFANELKSEYFKIISDIKSVLLKQQQTSKNASDAAKSKVSQSGQNDINLSSDGSADEDEDRDRDTRSGSSSDASDDDSILENQPTLNPIITRIAIILRMKLKKLYYKIVPDVYNNQTVDDFISITKPDVNKAIDTIINSNTIPDFLKAFNAVTSDASQSNEGKSPESNDPVEIIIDINIDSDLKMRILPNQPASDDSKFNDFELTADDVRDKSIEALIAKIPPEFLQKFHDLYEPTPSINPI